MKEILFSNNASTYLKNAITSTDTQFQVLDGTGILFPEPNNNQFFYVTLQHPQNYYFEIVKVLSRSGDTFVVERGQEDTLPYAFPEGTYIELRLTKESLNYLKEVIQELQFYQEHQFENTDEVIIEHDMNRYPHITIINDSGEVIYGDITYLDRNNVKIEFSTQLTGIVILS